MLEGKLTPEQMAQWRAFEATHADKVHNESNWPSDMPEWPQDTWLSGGHDPVMIARH